MPRRAQSWSILPFVVGFENVTGKVIPSLSTLSRCCPYSDLGLLADELSRGDRDVSAWEVVPRWWDA